MNCKLQIRNFVLQKTPGCAGYLAGCRGYAESTQLVGARRLVKFRPQTIQNKKVTTISKNFKISTLFTFLERHILLLFSFLLLSFSFLLLSSLPFSFLLSHMDKGAPQGVCQFLVLTSFACLLCASQFAGAAWLPFSSGHLDADASIRPSPPHAPVPALASSPPHFCKSRSSYYLLPRGCTTRGVSNFYVVSLCKKLTHPL